MSVYDTMSLVELLRLDAEQWVAYNWTDSEWDLYTGMPTKPAKQISDLVIDWIGEDNYKTFYISKSYETICFLKLLLAEILEKEYSESV